MGFLRAGILTSLLFTMSLVHAQFEQAVSYRLAALKSMHLKSPASGKQAEINQAEKYCLFVFLSPECPLSQQYTLALNELAKTYNKELGVIGIFPGNSYDRKTILAFLKKYKISFATYIDESKALSNYLSATVTPEVILLNNNTGNLDLQYRGAIDDRVKKLGVKRISASNYYLKNAIEQCLANHEVVIKRTDPVGCLINDY